MRLYLKYEELGRLLKIVKFTSPPLALGSCIPNLGRFLASNYTAKHQELGKILLWDEISPHWTSSTQLLVTESQSEESYYFFNFTLLPCFYISIFESSTVCQVV